MLVDCYRTLVARHSIFIGIVCLALCVRIAVIVFVMFSPAHDSITSIDALSYQYIAQNLVEHYVFTSPLDPPYSDQQSGTFRPPLTPLFLAGIYYLFGVNLLWGRIGLAILSAFSCGLTYKIGQQLFGELHGILAGIISCCYPFFLLLVLLPLTEGLSIFLSLLLICMLYSFSPSFGSDGLNDTHLHPGWAFATGVGFGCLLLNKAANVVIFPTIFFWAIFSLGGNWRKRCLRLAVVIVAAALTILPWTIRNYGVTGIVLPINSNGGWTFYLGNNEWTEKNLQALEDGTSNGWIPPKDVFKPFSDLAFHDIKNYEKRALALGVNFIREQPSTFFTLALRKLRIFWSPYHHILDSVSWYPLALFGIAGCLLSFPRWKKHYPIYAFMLASMSIPIFFTSMPRFRAPIMPFIILYSSAGLIQFYSFVRRLFYANRY